MQKTILTKAVAVALATLGAGAAMAQSTVTLYGNLDAAIDHVNIGSGTSPVILPALAGGATVNPKVAQSLSRVTPSISSVNAFGIKGSEDLGDGYKGSFVLEGQVGLDNGSLGNDSRIFGRQAYAGLTTPFGEFRMGRQYAPMFYSFALTTPDAMGATDVYAAGVTINNLQVRQDNQLSYWLKTGPWMAVASYSPNAGVAERISGARSVATASTPVATSATGEILGGATANTESSTRRGQSVGLLLAYMTDTMRLLAAYHGNKFGVDAGIYNVALGGYVPFYRMGDYSSFSLNGRFNLGSPATRLSVGFHQGKFDLAGTGAAAALVTVSNATVQTLGLGIRQDIGNFSIGAEGGVSRFTNFTKGKNEALVLIGDYNLSKRTTLYTRVGQVRDHEGSAVATSASLGAAGNITLHGGPFSGLTSLGSSEIPMFAGAGVNAGGKTSYVGVGIRHSF
ncbi:MAG: porin [Burkholderiales bacterium]|nr:porin [Burkholderiales bacterium]